MGSERLHPCQSNIRECAFDPTRSARYRELRSASEPKTASLRQQSVCCGHFFWLCWGPLWVRLRSQCAAKLDTLITSKRDVRALRPHVYWYQSTLLACSLPHLYDVGAHTNAIWHMSKLVADASSDLVIAQLLLEADDAKIQNWCWIYKRFGLILRVSVFDPRKPVARESIVETGPYRPTDARVIAANCDAGKGNRGLV